MRLRTGVARIVMWRGLTSRKSLGHAGLALLVAGLGVLATSILLSSLDFGTEALRLCLQIAVAVAAGALFLAALSIRRISRDRQQIAESELRFRRAMEDSAIGIVVVGLDGRIRQTNPAFAAMLGYTSEEIEALTFFQITHPDDLLIGRETMDDLKAGTVNSFHFEKRYLRKDGTPVWAHLAGSVIRDETSGRPLYLVSQIENIDARKQAEARIAEAETRWNFALAGAGQGVWDLDMRKGGTTYSSTWVKMLGYADGELDGDTDRWLTMIHPDDRETVAEADRAHLEGKTPFFEAEFRMRHKDGHWMWILDRGKAIERDENGRLIRAIGSLTDITRRKEAEERLTVSAAMLADEKERLRVTLQSIGDAVICTDAANGITFMNPVAEKLTGIAGGEALGKMLGHVYWAVDEETGHRIGVTRPAVGVHAPADQNSRAVLIRRDDTRCSIRQVVSPIINERNEFCGLVIVFQDFTDARALQRQLAHAAAHDALTGLANRSSFIRAMEDLVGQARKDGTADTTKSVGGAGHQFMFIDLDHFKLVNDTGGHAAGDALLKRVAEAIRGVLGPDDIVARLGGDEFAVILKSGSAAGAKIAARSIIDAIGGLDFTWDGRLHVIGASIGLAAINANCGEVDEIIARADAACYAAKAAGRGCVSVASDARIVEGRTEPLAAAS
ncbi:MULTISPECIES: PAS domain S-box protein [Mesorhizobium]|uniref:PAS domain S-box protein n=8 Tax=Phyllobacteriaceae TaxID=69277 RepID=UPI000FCB96BA|nr:MULTISPECIES: PAS domain S-box protein [Mesorhizobium]MCF6127223.1 PAS domain S-box protein [Mesorhizobium ciceri]MCQ8818267.1 PAS domain S-box protein [Mesorhizobium sp. SEMIA396]RUX73862.1 PAS domain S-box protein [Mesorhizobium sp. M7A.F.Ca.CA.004.08.2.1]RUX86947.1 PAS domain S-box protein [Mesorhizobium sp. M7A.F.Ca.CA.004.08.1.1]RUY04927.1 PAS domain S-box protein [Mesorhizobium sp. M7A.F.Ca.CA.004.04.1.1]